MLRTNDMPGCCTMKVLSGFGNTHTTLTNRDRVTTRQELVAELRQIETTLRESGNATILATINSEQTLAAEALVEAGYAHSKWHKKGRHPETQVRLYYRRLIRE